MKNIYRTYRSDKLVMNSQPIMHKDPVKEAIGDDTDHVDSINSEQLQIWSQMYKNDEKRAFRDLSQFGH